MYTGEYDTWVPNDGISHTFLAPDTLNRQIQLYMVLHYCESIGQMESDILGYRNVPNFFDLIVLKVFVLAHIPPLFLHAVALNLTLLSINHARGVRDSRRQCLWGITM